jgi:hypothetical protein
MTVVLTISSTPGGTAISDNVDFGDITPGSSSSNQDLYIRHNDLINEITDCGFYITRYVGMDYPGLDADLDYAKLIEWGDLITPAGVRISQDESTWEYFKSGSGGGTIDYPKELSADAIIGSGGVAGEIQPGQEAYVQIGLTLPTSAGDAQARAFGLVFSFSATS